jgi:hypothetical protein
MESSSMSFDLWPGTLIEGFEERWADMFRAGNAKIAQDEARKANPPKPITIKSTRGTRAYRRTREGLPRGATVGTGMDPNSKPGRIRAFLASGPKPSAAIAQELGVTGPVAIELMRNDVLRGRIVKIGTARPLLYALPEAA